MKNTFFSFLIIFLFINSDYLESKEIKIIAKIGNQIITNVDIENEYKYLVSLNNDYQKLEKNKIYNFAKSSVIREKIKEIELKKYFKLGVQDSFLNNRIGEIYKNLGFSNSEDFQKYLSQFELGIEDIAKKIEIELMWNKLIYDKYKNQIIIKKEILKKKIIDDSKNRNMYNLSELIFTSKSENEDNEKVLEIYNSIKEIGFENTVLIFSKADSRKNSGKLGWIKELSLSEEILKNLRKINVMEITEPIQIQSGILILKLNDKKEADMSLVNIDEELNEVIKFETNKQLNVFSTIYFEKIKSKMNINE